MRRIPLAVARLLAIGLISALSLGGSCNEVVVEGEGGPHPKVDDSSADAPSAEGKAMSLTPAPEHAQASFQLTVRPGVADAGPSPARTPATPSALPEAATRALLARLPAIDAAATDVAAFALREGSKPPPLTGVTIAAPFPPQSAPDVPPPDVKAAPPGVLRFQPTGDVPLAPRITVTFATPMVAVTSHDTLAAEAVPARLTPAIEGRWRWVGTKTLYFDPVGRAPMATEFTVEVPAGVKDALGQPLAKGEAFTFRTPPPALVSHQPTAESVSIDPAFVAVFDQRVDPGAALAAVVVKAGGRRFPARQLTEAEARRDVASWQADKDLAGRWVAFRLTEKLPKDIDVTVTFPPGLPSAEGPRRTEKPLSWSFRTFGPFKVEAATCGWRDACYPGMSLGVRFTNPIDEDALRAKQVTASPAIRNFSAEADGAVLNLSGLTRGRTTYEVKLDPGLRDAFGQTLEGDTTVTWEVAASRPLLATRLNPMTVLDPAAKKRRLPAYVMNMAELEVELYRVKPSDWPAYVTYLQHRWNREKPPTPPGQKVFAQRIPTSAPAEELTEVSVDLAPALTGDFGQVVAIIRPTGIEETHEQMGMTAVTWVQATRIGLDALHDGDDLVAWATALADGQQLAGVEVTLAPQDTALKTDKSGLARFALPSSSTRQMLVARAGDDVAFLPDSEDGWKNEGAWQKVGRSGHVRAMTFDDRHLYRPDETVSVKGAVRFLEPGRRGDVALLPAGSLTALSWTAFDATNNRIGAGEAKVSPLGTFHLSLKLPKTPNLGSAYIALGGLPDGATVVHSFEIAEFRRPEFEVAATSSEGPHIVGGSATASVKASYFSGGPLPGADVTWVVTPTPASFTPPNQDDFIFGQWRPWWGWRDGGDGPSVPSERLSGLTDASGQHTVGLDFKAVSPPQPFAVTAEATVLDVNRQAWSTASTLLVHPASRYVGLRTPRWFVDPGRPITVEAIVADIDGKRHPGTPIDVRIARIVWRKVGKAWGEYESDVETCRVTSGADPVTCTFQPKAGGRHRVSARIEDPEKRPNETAFSVWVPGGQEPAARNLQQQSLTLIPDKKHYRPGDTAEILVQSPFPRGSGVYLTVRGDVAEETAFTLVDGAARLSIPIEAWMTPNLGLRVFVNGEAERAGPDGQPNPNLPRRPAYAQGSLSLSVPPADRRLSVEVIPAAERVEPGAETAVSVRVKDPSGAPVKGAEVALVVVDEAVLALSGHAWPDPVAFFHGARGESVSAWHLRERLLLATLAELQAAGGGADPELARQLAERMAAAAEEADGSMRKGAVMPAPSAMAPMAAVEPMPESAGSADAEPPPGPIAVRKNFDALALFLPDGVTDAEGQLKAAVRMPDNLTRYRVMAIAFSGAKHFGKGESNITARLPLMVRLSAPRFLNFGDQFELPVVVQNQTDAALVVDLAVRATNATLSGAAGVQVTVPANDRIEVRMPMAAARPGTARFQVGVASGRWADAAEVKLPVWTPATTEAFATYGEVDKGGVKQPVRLPGEVETGFGGLEIETSSTQLQALTDAVVYLVTYPYECSEQIASRMMSLAALKDVLTAFKSQDLPSPEAMVASVERDLERLRGLQGHSGGFAFWRRDQEAWPFLTVHVTHALLRVREKGFKVPDDMLERALSYLRDVRQHMRQDWYPEPVRRSIEAFALYVRARAGDLDAKRAAALLSAEGGPDKAHLELLGWLYPVFKAARDESTLVEIRRHLNNRVSETAGAAHFVTSYGDGAHLLLHSDRRVDGLLLEGLIADQPASDLIPKLVRGLLGHKKKGRWESTQENAAVLLALDVYFRTFEKEDPDFIARAWLGDRFAGEHAFKGRTTERHAIAIPMQQLADLGGTADLTLAKDGPGRMYYRVGMRYAPKSLKLAPSEHGFHVERRYVAVDDPKDVSRDADGRWVVRAGARVKVELTMHTEDRRYHVALVDPMPAGFEALNPELRGTGTLPPRAEGEDGGPRRGRWWGPWYEHENLRDERAEAFTPLLWEGVYSYTWYARATTPGTFVVPPPKAEEMYSPETFGRGASDVVVVR